MNRPHDPYRPDNYGQPGHAPHGAAHAPYGPPGGYPPPPPRKSPALLIVLLTAGFLYALFFVLYFTGALDRALGRTAAYPAALQGAWCEVGIEPDEARFSFDRDRTVQRVVRDGEVSQAESALQAVSGNLYAQANLASGRVTIREYVIDSADRMRGRVVQRPDGTPPDTEYGDFRKCE